MLMQDVSIRNQLLLKDAWNLLGGNMYQIKSHHQNLIIHWPAIWYDIKVGRHLLCRWHKLCTMLKNIIGLYQMYRETFANLDAIKCLNLIRSAEIFLPTLDANFVAYQSNIVRDMAWRYYHDRSCVKHVVEFSFASKEMMHKGKETFQTPYMVSQVITKF